MEKKLLYDVMASHSLWVETGGVCGERANLSGAGLRGANLWRANLRGADLSDANLRWANLSGVKTRK